VRAYYEDTDAGGIVYHASYLRWMERARTEWLRSLGWSRPNLVEKAGLQFVVSALDIRYHHPARLDDSVRVEVALHEVRRASLRLVQSCWLEPDPNTATVLPARLLTRASVRLATVACTTGQPKPFPYELAHRLHTA